MAKYTTGYVTIPSTGYLQYGNSVNLQVTFNGNAYTDYVQENVPVVNPCGLISIPVTNKMAFYQLSPNGTTGYITGFANEMPAPDLKKGIINNVAGLSPGETALSETSDFNYNIQAKLNGLISIFTDKRDPDSKNWVTYTSNIGIAENVVLILQDIIAEIIALETAYNSLINTFNAFNTNFMAHTHTGGTLSGGNTGPTATQFPHNNNYTASQNFTEDNTFINRSPSEMYININGVILKHPL